MPRPGLAAKPNEPETPTDVDLRDLPRAVRAELRGLSLEVAEIVGAHLLKAGELIGSDPQLAYAHAEAARRRAARLSVTREATAEAAYAAGEYQVALAELRALRRMNGGNEFLAVMADCERALGHPDKALKLIKEGLAGQPDFAQRIELRLVEAGARVDLDQQAEALRLLKHEIEASAGRGTRGARASLRYGYADLLEQTGDTDGAERWFAAAAALDEEGVPDAIDRINALQGVVLEVDEEAFYDDSEDAAAPDADEDAEATDGPGAADDTDAARAGAEDEADDDDTQPEDDRVDGDAQLEDDGDNDDAEEASDQDQDEETDRA